MGVIFKFFLKKLHKKHSPNFFWDTRYMNKVVRNIFKTFFFFFAPLDQIWGQNIGFTCKVWILILTSFCFIYSESPFNLWKNDTKMKFLGGVVSELQSFEQDGSSRRPENWPGHNFWPVYPIYVKIKNLEFLTQHYCNYTFSLKSETWGCSALDELTWNDPKATLSIKFRIDNKAESELSQGSTAITVIFF